jgi:hypothetical protein
MENLAIVVTGSETGKFGQAGHTEYASGKAGLQYGLVRGVKNEIVRLNSKARINAVAPGWVDTPLIEGRLDDLEEMWTEAQATVPLRKIAQPEDVARTMAFLASHRAAGHITGECISVDGGMEGRIVWKKDEVIYTSQSSPTNPRVEKTSPVIPIPILVPIPPKRKIQVILSVDFDAVSGFLGTGASSTNDMAAYSSGFLRRPSRRPAPPQALQKTQNLISSHMVHPRPFNGNIPYKDEIDLRQRSRNWLPWLCTRRISADEWRSGEGDDCQMRRPEHHADGEETPRMESAIISASGTHCEAVGGIWVSLWQVNNLHS